MYLLLKGANSKQKSLCLNLYLLGGVLLSLSEDGTFLQQLYDSVRLGFLMHYFNC